MTGNNFGGANSGASDQGEHPCEPNSYVGSQETTSAGGSTDSTRQESPYQPGSAGLDHHAAPQESVAYSGIGFSGNQPDMPPQQWGEPRRSGIHGTGLGAASGPVAHFLPGGAFSGGVPGFAQNSPQPSHDGGKKKIRSWIAPVVVLVVICLGFAFLLSVFRDSSGDISKLKKGDCIQVYYDDSKHNGGSVLADGVEHRVVDCSLPGQYKSVVVSVTKGQTQCAAEYAEYTQTSISPGGAEVKATSCVAPVFEKGFCYAADKTSLYRIVSCTSPQADFKVESEISGTNTQGCSKPADAAVFEEPSPGKVYCLIPPN